MEATATTAISSSSTAERGPEASVADKFVPIASVSAQADDHQQPNELAPLDLERVVEPALWTAHGKRGRLLVYTGPLPDPTLDHRVDREERIDELISRLDAGRV